MNKNSLLNSIDQNAHMLLENTEGCVTRPLIEKIHRDVHDLAAVLSDNDEIVATCVEVE